MVKITNIKYARFASLLFIFTMILFVCINYRSNDMRGVMVNGFGLICWIIIYVSTLLTNSTAIAIPFWMLFLAVMDFYWIYFGGHSGFGIYWTLVVAIFVFYGCSMRVALVSCFMILTTMIIFMWTPLKVYAYPYEHETAMNAPILFFLIVAGSCFMKAQVERLMREQVDLVYQAQSANRVKSAFLANTSHEIRTPINSILGMTEMILQECEDNNTLEYATVIDAAGKSLLGIINDVLDISKIEAGSMELVDREYSLTNLIRDCYAIILPWCKERNNELFIKYDENLPEVLYGDGDRLKQVVLNLLTNAAKYTDNGKVTLSVTGKRIADGVTLVFSVTDTGIGIKEDEKDKLFDNFTRLDVKKNATVNGTGLGLAISKRIVELMGGSITVDSVYQKGSTFSVMVKQKIVDDKPIGSIELSDYSEVINRAKNRQYFKAPGKRVLIVDDVPNNVKLFCHQLKHSEMEIDCACSGSEALFKLRDNQYDVIYLDKMMPEMDGIETLAKMKENGSLDSNKTTVVMLTADAARDTRDEAIQAGFDDYLTKPISSAELEASLKGILFP